MNARHDTKSNAMSDTQQANGVHFNGEADNVPIEATPNKPKHAGGRPPMPYDEEIALDICVRMSNGENVSTICKEPGMPSWDTLAKWRMVHSEFSVCYARAREASAEALEYQALEAASDANPLDFQAKRLLVDTYKWAASKRAPKVYGDRIDATITFHSGLADRLSAAMGRAAGRIIDVETGLALTEETYETVPRDGESTG